MRVGSLIDAHRSGAARGSHIKKAAISAVQISITAGVLWLVFHDPQKRAEMVAALRNAHPQWLLIGFAFCGTVELIAGLRWRLLLRVQSIDLGWRRVFTLLMIGVFFNFFVPGGTGGDMVKIFYLLKETPRRRAHALLSVLVDRLVGLFSLIALGSFFLTMHWHWLTDNPITARYVWPAVIILGCSCCGIAASFVITGCGLVHKLPASIPGRDRLTELAMAYHLYGRAWRPTLAAFLMSVVAHFCYFATFWSAAKSLENAQVHVPTFGQMATIMPIVNTISSMPISLGGVGVREGLFQVFLSNLAGVTQAVAVVISSTGYLLTLGWGLIGGLCYLLYRPSEHAGLREITAEVTAFEHEVAAKELALESAATKRKG